MLTHGKVLVEMGAEDDDSNEHSLEVTVTEFIVFELWHDQMSFENPIHQEVLDEFIHELSNSRVPDLQHFSMSPNPLISSFVINNVLNNYELSAKWKNFGVEVPDEVMNLKRGTQHLLYSLKEKKLNSYILEKQELLKNASEEDSVEIMKEIMHLTHLKSRVNKLLGRIVVK